MLPYPEPSAGAMCGAPCGDAIENPGLFRGGYPFGRGADSLGRGAHPSARGGYPPRRLRTVCGVELAVASTEVPAWVRI
jgi:hypothetical protein